METFKKIILAVLVAGNIGSVVFGMDSKERVTVEFDEALETDIRARTLRCCEMIDGKELQSDEFVMGACQYDYTELHSAISHGNSELVMTILSAIPEEQRVAVLTARDKHDNTALGLVLGFDSHDHIEVLRTILESLTIEQRIAVATVRNRFGETELHYALLGWLGIRNIEGIRILLDTIPVEERAKFIMIKDRLGCTALDHASSNCMGRNFSAIMVKNVLESVPSEERISIVTAINYHGQTVLHHAVEHLGKFLISGCKLDEGEEDGIVNVIKAILETVPSEQRIEALMVEDCNGRSVLRMTEKYKLEKIASMLLEFYPRQQVVVGSLVEASKKRTHEDIEDSHAPAPKVQEMQKSESSGCLM